MHRRGLFLALLLTGCGAEADPTASRSATELLAGMVEHHASVSEYHARIDVRRERFERGTRGVYGVADTSQAELDFIRPMLIRFVEVQRPASLANGIHAVVSDGIQVAQLQAFGSVFDAEIPIERTLEWAHGKTWGMIGGLLFGRATWVPSATEAQMETLEDGTVCQVADSARTGKRVRVFVDPGTFLLRRVEIAELEGPIEEGSLDWIFEPEVDAVGAAVGATRVDVRAMLEDRRDLIRGSRTELRIIPQTEAPADAEIFATAQIAGLAQLARHIPYGGIGMSLDGEDGAVSVHVTFPNSPAARAGLERGDVIVAVDGDSVRGLTSDEMVTRLRGPAATRVEVEVERAGERRSFVIQREWVVSPPPGDADRDEAADAELLEAMLSER